MYPAKVTYKRDVHRYINLHYTKSAKGLLTQIHVSAIQKEIQNKIRKPDFFNAPRMGLFIFNPYF